MFATTILGTTLSAVWVAMIALAWVVIALWPALVAKGKGYNFWLFLLLSIPFWWIMMFVVFFMPVKAGAVVEQTAETE